MVGKSVKLFVMCLVCSGWAHIPAMAQSVAVVSAPKSVLTTSPVTIHADAAPLKDVLSRIAQQAGLIAVYGDALAKSPKRVTLHVRDVTALEAFEKALAGTDFKAAIVSGNAFLKRPMPRCRTCRVRGVLLGR